MPSEKQVASVKKMLEARGADTPEKRRHIYDHLIRSLELRYPPESSGRESILLQLDNVIHVIEEEFSMSDKTATMDSSAKAPDASGTGQGGKSRALLAGAFVIAAGAAAFLAAGGWSALFGGDPLAMELSNYRALPEVSKTIDKNNAVYRQGEFEGKQTIVVTGARALASEKTFTVDAGKKYTMTVTLRVLKDDPASPSLPVSIGVATFDSEGKLETEAPGTHRYFVSVAKPLTKAEGVVTFEGEISGTGNKSHNTFRQGTKSVRPIVVANGSSKIGETEILEITFKDPESK